MRALRTALLAVAVIIAPLAMPTASSADPPTAMAVPDTTWRNVTTITGSAVAADQGAEFGYGVASDGTTLVVGAPHRMRMVPHMSTGDIPAPRTGPSSRSSRLRPPR